MFNTEIVKTKRILSILLILVMTVLLCGCGSDSQTEEKASAGDVVEETENSITIIDQAGREVTVKKNVKSIAVCYRVVIRFLLNLEQGEKIKGVGKTEDFLYKLEPALKNATDVGKGVADIEALAELNPDVFFHKAHDVKTLDSVERMGIPAIGISVENTEDMKEAIEIMGKICGAEEKATELIDYYDKKLTEFEKLTLSINSKDKKTAIMMGSSLGDVANGTMIQSKMIELAGGANLAKDIDSNEVWPTAGIEQIFQWNPDYIFITGSESATYTVDDILENPKWRALTAVKNGDVYVMPAENDSWEFPGIVSILGMEYIMKTMYPQLISEEKLVEDVNELYTVAYGKEFSRKELGY